MRRAFVDTLTELAAADDRVAILTGDLGFQVFDRFIERFPDRYVNVGIAEAQVVCAAAGMARAGFRPFAYSIASFMTARPFEQIRFAVGYPRLPVVFVGAGGGYCYAQSGVSHHAPDDFALMGLIPGMTVVSPGDPHEVHDLLPQLVQLDGPSYIRIGKFGEPAYEADFPIVLGKGRILRPGRKVAILTAGETAPIALDALQRLAPDGISPTVCQFHTLRPLDTAMLAELAAARHTAFVCAEECSPQGGLHQQVALWIQSAGLPIRHVRLGPPDEFVLGNPDRNAFRAACGFDAAGIADACRRAWHAT